MYINLETARKLVDYPKLEQENKALKKEIVHYIGVIKKYEKRLLKKEKKETRKKWQQKKIIAFTQS